ncbi:ATP-dependent endonuclease [Brevibacillus laterosporus]|uniref:ATP-dependent nuclease n=1 Tax=Brevibacillus laterosporus TaxID=1465 RepID=UPI000C760D54|nr:AAA family ATPase [Brevibacillus laterosporus]AUM63297.1 ATP-dependent endonuclease [Brevibacillus laterosporus]
MKLERVMLKNYRNFIDTEITFGDKTLLIGANDIGKTNIIDAIRLLLDKSLSENDLVPTDEDFCALNHSNSFEVFLKFVDTKEDCIRAKFPEHISDEDELFLAFIGTRTVLGGKKDYQIKVGRSLDSLEEAQGRFYLRVLNFKYVSANRQIDKFLRSQKNTLLETLTSLREEGQIGQDEEKLQVVHQLMKDVRSNVDDLSYIRDAGTRLNQNLQDLAEHHINQEIRLGFDVPQTNDLFKKVQMLSYINDQPIQLGGDGRKNQTFIALWAALNDIENSGGQPDEVTIFCIEEPEAHLHPHQQRKLSKYLIEKINTQVILTSHSPFIASEFQHDSIVRLQLEDDKSTKAAQNGVSQTVGDAAKALEFRINVVSSEVYFSDCVLLVEGSSEVLFYKALAKCIGIDLDKLNISILSVEGVGFKKYIELFDTLGIPWVIRTDNDYRKQVIKKKGKVVEEYYQLTGIMRATACALMKEENLKSEGLEEVISFFEEHKGELTKIKERSEDYRQDMYKQYFPMLRQAGVYISNISLEEDLYFSTANIMGKIRENFNMLEEDYTDQDVVERMKKKKLTFMFYFLDEYFDILTDLEEWEIAQPLHHCKRIVEDMHHV